jgi:hypothetical protein
MEPSTIVVVGLFQQAQVCPELQKNDLLVGIEAGSLWLFGD